MRGAKELPAEAVGEGEGRCRGPPEMSTGSLCGWICMVV